MTVYKLQIEFILAVILVTSYSVPTHDNLLGGTL